MRNISFVPHRIILSLNVHRTTWQNFSLRRSFSSHRDRRQCRCGDNVKKIFTYVPEFFFIFSHSETFLQVVKNLFHLRRKSLISAAAVRCGRSPWPVFKTPEGGKNVDKYKSPLSFLLLSAKQMHFLISSTCFCCSWFSVLSSRIPCDKRSKRHKDGQKSQLTVCSSALMLSRLEIHLIFCDVQETLDKWL